MNGSPEHVEGSDDRVIAKGASQPFQALAKFLLAFSSAPSNLAPGSHTYNGLHPNALHNHNRYSRHAAVMTEKDDSSSSDPPRLGRRRRKESADDALAEAKARWAANEQADKESESKEDKAAEQDPDAQWAKLNEMLAKSRSQKKLYRKRGDSADEAVADAMARWAANEEADKKEQQEQEEAEQRELEKQRAAFETLMSRELPATEVDEERLLKAGIPENKVREAAELVSAATKAEAAAADAVAKARKMMEEASEKRAEATALLKQIAEVEEGLQIQKDFAELVKEQTAKEQKVEEMKAKLGELDLEDDA